MMGKNCKPINGFLLRCKEVGATQANQEADRFDALVAKYGYETAKEMVRGNLNLVFKER